MSFHLLLRCEARGCSSEREIDSWAAGAFDGLETGTDPWPDKGALEHRGQFWVESGWTVLPAGWAWNESGTLLCPVHAPEPSPRP